MVTEQGPGTRVSVLGGEPAELGESPVWDESARVVTYVDMVNGSVDELAIDDGELRRTHVAPFVGAVVPTQSGTHACVTVDSIGVLTPDGFAIIQQIVDDERLRLNDAASDTHGRLWVGSTSRADKVGAGALHRWRPGEQPEVVAAGLTQPNGIGWSPDGDFLYIADTPTSAVLRARFNEKTGECGDLEPFIHIERELPDGLAVAVDGSLWVALWDGAALAHFSADGDLLDKVSLPTRRPTSCAFTESGQLLVTTARYGLEPDSQAADSSDGHVLSVDVGILGAAVGRLSL